MGGEALRWLQGEPQEPALAAVEGNGF